MKMLKKLCSVVMSIVLICTLFACSSSNVSSGSSDSANKKFKIGTIQLIQHEALDASRRGFEDYLRENNVNFEVDFQNAAGEQSNCNTIAEKFANGNYDLCYAIATPAAQAAKAKMDTVPIIASAVTDPEASQLCKSNKKPGGNLTAASDLTPVEAQFDLLVELLPDAKRVGILYCSAEANSKIQANMALDAAKKRNLEAKEFTVVTTNDIQTVVESMLDKVDVIYVPTDNIVSAGFDLVATICLDNKMPTIVGEEAMVDKGGLATYGIDYYSLGKLAGELAKEVLVNGANPGDLPVKYLDADSCKRKINSKTAEALGINVK